MLPRLCRGALVVAAILGNATAAPVGFAVASKPLTRLGSHKRPGDLTQQKVRRTQSTNSDKLLRQWLKSLTLHIPDINATKGGIEFSLLGGVCNGLELDDIQTTRLDTGVRVQADGLAIGCKLQWSAHSFLIRGKGAVLAQVNHSSIHGTLELKPGGGHPPLPSALAASDCGGKIIVDTLQFSGDPLSDVLELLRGLIKDILDRELAGIICTNVDGLINDQGTAAVKNASAAVEKFLETPSHSPAPPSDLPEPHTDFIDFTQNSAVQFIADLATRVLGNASSPHSLSAMLGRFLGAGGNLSLNALGIFPVTKAIHLANVGTINVTINGLAFSGLDKWSRMEFKSSDPQQLGMAFGLEDFSTNASISLLIVPDSAHGPLHGDALKEDFDVRLALTSFGLSAGMFMAVNSTYLRTLSGDQLPHLGCLAPGFHSLLATDAGLNLSLVQLDLSPNGAGSLERDVDGMLNLVLAKALEDFAVAVESIGNHALSVTGRDLANARLVRSLKSPPPCPEPGSLYAAPPLSNAILKVAATVGTIVIISTIVGLCFHRLSARSAEKAMARGPGALPLTESAADNGQAGGGPSSQWPTLCQQGEGNGPEERAVAADPGLIALARHPRLPCALRVGLPALVCVCISLFMSSNSGEGAEVRVSIQVSGQEIATLPPVFSFSLISSIRDMWRGGVYPLAMLIAAFSGIWPYGKLILMLICWFSPPQKLSVHRRQKLLDFLDAYGKWSLVDTFVLVVFMVAFRFELSGMNTQSKDISGLFHEFGSDGKFLIYIQDTPAFHSFLIASLLSLIVGHAMTACHRYAMQVGEWGLADAYVGTEVLRGGKRRLCNKLRPQGLKGKVFAYGPTAAVALSFVLVLIGIFLETFQFKFLGLAGWVLGAENSVRPYSVISLGAAVPASALHAGELSAVWIQIAYLTFSAVIMPVYLVILICLWTVPLTNRQHRHFLVWAQVLNAWAGLDVFCLSIMASVLEIRQFALFVVGDKCDGIDALIAKTPLADQLEGPKTCFDLETQLRPGFYILAAAAVISFLTGHFTLRNCSKALLEPGAAQSSPRISVL